MSMTLSRRYGRKNFKQSCSCSEAGKKQLNKVSVSRKISKSIFKIEFCEGLLCSACIFIYFQTNMNKCFFFMCLHVHLKSHGSLEAQEIVYNNSKLFQALLAIIVFLSFVYVKTKLGAVKSCNTSLDITTKISEARTRIFEYCQ